MAEKTRREADSDAELITRRLHDGDRCALCGVLFEDGDSLCSFETRVEFSVFPPAGSQSVGYRIKLLKVTCHQECLESEVPQ
jgi:hypothetical protein